MDFGYNEENERFRKEIKDFLVENVSREFREEVREMQGRGMGPLTKDLILKIGAKGWIGMSWPEEYGGRNADRIDQYIFEEELVRARVPLNIG
ncbi:MAG: acyl-CoA dehydrogenase family protein, partial [Pseudomonadales bacterium]|nr:acyl-CoA dehydrogenase family protein [Pseudomonadales bacterium]